MCYLSMSPCPAWGPLLCSGRDSPGQAQACCMCGCTWPYPLPMHTGPRVAHRTHMHAHTTHTLSGIYTQCVGQAEVSPCPWNRIPSPSKDVKALEPLALPAPHLPSLRLPHSVCSSHTDVLLIPDHTELSSRVLCSTILSPWTSCYGSDPTSRPQGTFLTILLKVCPSLPGVFIILHFSDPFE